MFDSRREFIFGDVRPFAQCHASALVETPEASVLAAWFGGTREGESDVGIWAASRRAAASKKRDGPPGENWEAPRCIAKISEEPHWNPVLYSLNPNGEELALQFKVGSSIRSWVTYLARSFDGGESWHEAQPLELADHDSTRAPAARGGRGAVRNAPVRLSSGDWLAGASTETWKRWDAFFDRSADGVKHWRATPLVPLDRSSFAGKGLIQPTLWESLPGRVHALFRSTDGRIYRSDSEDDGHSFDAAYPLDLPNNNSGLDVARLRNGCLALVCNPVSGNWAERTPLSILFSWDNGKSWPRRIDLEDEPGEFSYPAIIATGPEGDDLSLTYTWNRRRIAYISLSADEIPADPNERT